VLPNLLDSNQRGAPQSGSPWQIKREKGEFSCACQKQVPSL
jgi:hypothetical protein